MFAVRHFRLVEVVENMRSWQHSGFSVDQSVFLPAGDVSASRRCFCQPAMGRVSSV